MQASTHMVSEVSNREEVWTYYTHVLCKVLRAVLFLSSFASAGETGDETTGDDLIPEP
jgi:hypothetical protein